MSRARLPAHGPDTGKVLWCGKKVQAGRFAPKSPSFAYLSLLDRVAHPADGDEVILQRQRKAGPRTMSAPLVLMRRASDAKPNGLKRRCGCFKSLDKQHLCEDRIVVREQGGSLEPSKLLIRERCLHVKGRGGRGKERLLRGHLRRPSASRKESKSALAPFRECEDPGRCAACVPRRHPGRNRHVRERPFVLILAGTGAASSTKLTKRAEPAAKDDAAYAE